jgi:hypothetical protein
MDVETLTSLALLAFYLLYQVLSGRKQKQPPKPSPSAPKPRPAPSSDLEEALREIQEALRQRPTAPPQPQPSAPSSARLPEGLHTRRLPKDFQSGHLPEGLHAPKVPEGLHSGRVPKGMHSPKVPGGLHSQQVPKGMHSPVVKGRETFARPTYDDAFENAEAIADYHRREDQAYRDFSLEDPFEQQTSEAFVPETVPRQRRPVSKPASGTPPGGRPTSLLALLRKPGHLRDVILFQEILAPPRSKRPLRG